MLQFIVIGSAIIADRYTYVPYIGLFFLFGWLLHKKFAQKLKTAYAIIFSIGIVFMFITYKQAATWESCAALWDNAIAKTPGSVVYLSRATIYYKEGKREQALACYNEAIAINAASFSSFGERGNIYFEMGIDSSALAGFNQALSINPNYVIALNGRGTLYARQGKFDLGIPDLNKAIQLDPQYKDAYGNRANIYFQTRHYATAIRDYEKFLLYDPGNDGIYNTIGVCYQNLGKYELSLKPFSAAVTIRSNPEYFLNRSYSWYYLGKLSEAREDARKARQGGIQIPDQFARLLGI